MAKAASRKRKRFFTDGPIREHPRRSRGRVQWKKMSNYCRLHPKCEAGRTSRSGVSLPLGCFCHCLFGGFKLNLTGALEADNLFIARRDDGGRVLAGTAL